NRPTGILAHDRRGRGGRRHQRQRVAPCPRARPTGNPTPAPMPRHNEAVRALTATGPATPGSGEPGAAEVIAPGPALAGPGPPPEGQAHSGAAVDRGPSPSRLRFTPLLQRSPR